MPQTTKNQHFVPQSLLKHFSDNQERVVYIYDSKRDKLRPPTSVNRVLSENYFYDRDNLIENFLAESVEGPAAPIFEGIVCDPQKRIVCNKIDLLKFITVQLNRTPIALFDSLENIGNFTDLLIQQHGELNGFDPEVLKDIKFKINNPKAILVQQTIERALNWPLIDDLEWHLLIDQTNIGFLICDHPVVHYNWYLRDSNDVSYTSIASCGIQIFLPISHSITLCLYDKKIYNLGQKSAFYTELKNESDVLLLNELQFRNRDSFIVFSSRTQSDYILKACKKFPANSLHENNAWASDFTPLEDKNLSQQSPHGECKYI